MWTTVNNRNLYSSTHPDSIPSDYTMTSILSEAITDSLQTTNASLAAASTEIVKTIMMDGIEGRDHTDNTTTLTTNFQDYPDADVEYIFDRTDVRAIFLTLYTIVFCSCFFGNLMVILVVCLHWRMRSITNFCLANLAFADLCVGIFCVYQHIISYMVESWIFGEWLCKMYHFISSLSTTASILILVVICIERYLAIIHPMQCKRMLTLSRLRLTIVGVWIISALISCPRFYYFKIQTMPLPDDKVEVMCIPNRLVYDSKLVDMIHMSLLFLLPLLIISILYFRIGVSLWKSSNANMPSASTSASAESSSSSGRCESNAGQNDNHPSHPYCSSGGGRRKKSIVRQLNHYLPCIKGSGRKRHRRSSGSFYGSERPNYATQVNLTTINGSAGAGVGVGNNSRNVNGLQISCNGGNSTTLTPILKSSSLSQSTSPHQPNHNNVPQCCSGCTRAGSTTSSRGDNSVPVSPYLMKRDSTPLSSPLTTSINTEPIVLVKFEKKSSLRKCRRNQCTILMRPTLSPNILNHSTEENNGEIGGCRNIMGNNHHNHSSITCTTPTIDENGPSYGNGSTASKTTTMEIASSGCQVCEKNDPAVISNGGGSHDHHHFSPKLLDGCEENVDDSHLVLKDSSSMIQGPHQSLVHFGHHHCGFCQTPPPGVATCGANNHHHHYSSSSFKGQNNAPGPTTPTIKGPKRMRIVRSSKYGTRALDARRRIIRMLIVIVVAFAVCHLPFHARKIWQYWGKSYEAGSVFSSLFTPITFLISYSQSGINPILYAFMSRKFRNSFADLLCCNMRRSLKMSRNLSVRSTNVVQLSQAA